MKRLDAPLQEKTTFVFVYRGTMHKDGSLSVEFNDILGILRKEGGAGETERRAHRLLELKPHEFAKLEPVSYYLAGKINKALAKAKEEGTPLSFSEALYLVRCRERAAKDAPQ